MSEAHGQRLRDDGAAAAAIVRERTGIAPEFGLILGSGLGGVAALVEDAVRIPYGELPGLPVSGVSGHAGEVLAGRIAGVPVVMLSGRVHYFESGDAAAMRPAIGMLRALGCHSLLITNSAGSLRQHLAPGDLMQVTDHIAFSGPNPLIGEKDERRFVGMTSAYDEDLRYALRFAADAEGIPLDEGVYIWFSGPSFETPAEIRAARALGADAVGMSTVPEVILARYFGLRVACISTVVNFAAGMTGNELSHDETKRNAPLGAVKLEKVFRRFFQNRAG